MLALTNARMFNKDGNILEEQVILVENGEFTAIGKSVDIPADYEVIDVAGKFVTPGLIDVHTHLGVAEEAVGREGNDFNEMSDPVTAQIRAIDGINPREGGFHNARKAGVTTVQVMPGSANILGGEMAVMKTAGHIVDQMVIKSPSGMKGATGENPKRVYGEKNKLPMTRMGLAAKLREKLIETQNYIDGDQKERKLDLENLAKVLNKEIPLRVHAHRADDILTVLRIKREFDIDITIEHCTEGHLIADYIAEHDVRASIGPTMSTRSKVELKDMGWDTLKSLTEAGVPCSITTDHPVIGIEHLVTSAIYAIKEGGLTEQEAFLAITQNAAKHIGVEDQVGSIEVGKDADFVIWSGHLFDLMSEAEQVFIDGELV